MSYWGDYFKLDWLSGFVAVFVVFFTILITIYSLSFMRGRKGLVQYYLYILLTMLVSLGVVFTNHLVVFMVCWGILALLLYLLIGFGRKQNASATAKKTFIIIGGTDAFMLLGVAFIYQLTNTFWMDKINLGLNVNLAVWAYLCLAGGAFAKAGAMPFHTWVPDTAQDAPVSVAAYLPASLDKLLGIYFLARISLDMFKLDLAMNNFLMFAGSFTVVAAVMMALVQHDLKRLLGYHAVSQVGYMILGIGTGNPIGIAGGLFHMLNNAVYKSCLFLSGGAVEYRKGTTNLDELGGLARFMPFTFITFLIASLAISGVPPFNGFVSKWMVYQGIISTGETGSKMWIVWLVAAMFGSALTLASFMKLIHAVFLGQSSTNEKVKEVGPSMWMPVVILALLCVLFGVFAYQIPLKMFILPSLGVNIEYLGVWKIGVASLLMVIALLIGGIIYWLGTVGKAREVEGFVGGERIQEHPDMRVSGAQFYNTISRLFLLRAVYKLAKNKLFDVYVVGSKITFAFNSVLRYLHNGVLPTYLAWCLLAMGIIIYVLLLK